MNDPLLGRIGAPIAYNAKCVRDLNNQATMDQFDANSHYPHKSQVWGGAFWQLRKVVGPEIADKLVVLAWLTACSSMEDFELAFVNSLLNEAKKLEQETLIQEIRKILLR